MYYIGTVDGHNLEDLVAILQEVKNTESPGPVLIHIITEKGRGYRPAESAQDKYHGVNKFNFATGEQQKAKPKAPSYTQVFVEALIAEARVDDRVVAIHAAMGGGTGLTEFEKHFPKRVFDVGIAEQHAVTFAAGLAVEGMKPFCAIYSTFLQRAYDQVVHDCALQGLPVRFAMDRAGLVGADGPTHAGAYDVAYLGCVPDMVLMAPSDEAELCHAVATAAAIDDRSCGFRYPRGNGVGLDLAAAGVVGWKGQVLEIGKGRVLRQGTQVALLAYGTLAYACLDAARMLEERGVQATVADARFCKPLDTDLVRRLAKEHAVLITVEEGSIGGFGSHVLQFLALDGLLDTGRLKACLRALAARFVLACVGQRARRGGLRRWRRGGAGAADGDPGRVRRPRRARVAAGAGGPQQRPHRGDGAHAGGAAARVAGRAGGGGAGEGGGEGEGGIGRKDCVVAGAPFRVCFCARTTPPRPAHAFSTSSR